MPLANPYRRFKALHDADRPLPQAEPKHEFAEKEGYTYAADEEEEGEGPRARFQRGVSPLCAFDS